jgi:hypothetical protein
MTQTADANKVPWIISFQRKDLLAAGWGGEKEANLLHHLIKKASREAQNRGLQGCNITFEDEHEKILKDAPMAEGTLITYLKRFNLAGYITIARYGSTLTVHLEAIQAAFTNPPAKPLSAPRGRPKGCKVSRIKKTKNSETYEERIETSRINETENSETLEKSEVSNISDHDEVLNLKLEVLILKEKVLSLELELLNLKLSESAKSASQASAEEKNTPYKYLDKALGKSSDNEGTYSASEIDNALPTGADAQTPAPDPFQDFPGRDRSTLEGTSYQPDPHTENDYHSHPIVTHTPATQAEGDIHANTTGQHRNSAGNHAPAAPVLSDEYLQGAGRDPHRAAQAELPPAVEHEEQCSNDRQPAADRRVAPAAHGPDGEVDGQHNNSNPRPDVSGTEHDRQRGNVLAAAQAEQVVDTGRHNLVEPPARTQERDRQSGRAGDGTAPAAPTAVGPQPAAQPGTRGYTQAEQQTLVEVPAQSSAHVEKPTMPPGDAKWCPETLVQIVEAKIKKPYREASREKQIAAARRILREDPELTRERFVLAYDERDDDWWHEKKGLLHVNHMAEKDRVHEMLDRIDVRNARQASRTATPNNQPPPHRVRAVSPSAGDGSARLPDDLAQRNKDRLKEKYDAIMAAKAQVQVQPAI